MSQRNPAQHEIEMSEEQLALFGELTNLQQKIAICSIQGMTNIDAYYEGGGKAKTKLTGEACASEILNNPKVKAFVLLMKQEAVKGAVMGRTEMLERLSTLARVNMSDLVDWSTVETTGDEGEKVIQSVWAIKESAKLDEHKMASISEVVAGKDGFKIKQHSPLSAMKQLADLEGFNAATKQELTGKDGGAIETADMSERELARRIAFALAKGARK